MTTVRQLMLDLIDVETAEQAHIWSVRLEVAYDSGLVSKKAYELLQGELQMHLRFENIELNTVNQ
jgi:hypothetical protein